MVETARRDNEEPCDPDEVQFYLPLCPFERHQLLDLGHYLNNEDLSGIGENFGDVLQQREAFHAWVWYGKVRSILDGYLGEEALMEDYQGDRNRAYEESLKHLAQDLPVGAGMNLARTELIRNANQDFLIKLGNKPIEDVTISAVDHDEEAWTVLSVIYLTYGWQWKLTATHEKEEGDFDIWKLIRSFAISIHRPNNQREIQRLLFQHTLFTELFSIQAFAPSSAEFMTHLGPVDTYRRLKGPALQVS